MFVMFTRVFLKMRLGGKRVACPRAWLTGQLGSGHRQGHQQQGFQMSYRACGGPRASQRFRSRNSSIRPGNGLLCKRTKPESGT